MDDSEEHDAEYFKALIVQTDPNFYLVPARNPEDTFQVLWYRLPRRGRTETASSNNASMRQCKVDILLPGPEHLSIPFIPPDRISHPPRRGDAPLNHDRIPLVPFLTLVLLKVRGWSDHRVDHRQRMRDKVFQDEEDLESLLELAIDKYSSRVEDEVDLWEDWFVEESELWVDEYVEEWRDSASAWSEMGFEIQSDSESLE